jgi:hypothetical protein
MELIDGRTWRFEVRFPGGATRIVTGRGRLLAERTSAMSAFREHFLDKYFGYRRRYVDHFLTAAPDRAQLARASEVVRLGFSTFGSALCATIFWALFVASTSRAGGPFAVGPLTFLVCALVPTAFALLAVRGAVEAYRDRERIEAALRG